MASVYKKGGKANRHGYYYAAWTDAEGRRQTRCTKTTDRDAAQQFANKLESAAMLRREGIIDATTERFATEGRRLIEELLSEFEAKMRAASRSVRHVADTLRMVREAAAFAAWKTVGGITADGAVRFAEKLRTEPRHPSGKRRDRAARTVASYLRALKSFTRWLHREGKLPADPLAGVKCPNADADRRHERRALLPEEWRWLEAVTRSEPRRYGMEGPQRALLFRVAIETGLRANELRSLTRASLRLDDAVPCIVVKARSTKNKRDAR